MTALRRVLHRTVGAFLGKHACVLPDCERLNVHKKLHMAVLFPVCLGKPGRRAVCQEVRLAIKRKVPVIAN